MTNFKLKDCKIDINIVSYKLFILNVFNIILNDIKKYLEK